MNDSINVTKSDYEKHFGIKIEEKKVSVAENPLRVGRFTSGEAFRLMSCGKRDMTRDELAARPKKGKGSKTTTVYDLSKLGDTALSYIHEKNLERKLGRSLSLDKGDNSTKWGKFLEKRVNDLLPMSYDLMSDVTIAHPKHGDIWVGTQDTVSKKDGVVCDTKCYEPKNFAEYNDVLLKAKQTQDLTEWKKEYAKEYWQLISNACIWNFDFIEVDLYMPYESELPVIKEQAYNYEGDNPYEYRFIWEYSKSKLAYLPDGNKYYKNLNRYVFEAPKEDKEALEARIVMAGKELIKVELAAD